MNKIQDDIKKARKDLEELNKTANQNASLAELFSEPFEGVGPLPEITIPKTMGGLSSGKPEQITASRVGTAEAQAKMEAFRAGAGSSEAKKTANNTEEIKNTLGEIRDEIVAAFGSSSLQVSVAQLQRM